MKKELQEMLVQAAQDKIATHFACAVVQPHATTLVYEGAQADTLFDLASLTKVILTTSACARAYQDQRFDPHSPIGLQDVLPSWMSACTFEDLLTHRSGLPAWLDFWQVHPDKILDTIAQTKQEYEPRSKTVYSDVGFLLLGVVLEKALGLTPMGMFDHLPQAVRKHVHPWQRLSLTQKNNMVPVGSSRHRSDIHDSIFDDNAFSMKSLQAHTGLVGTLEGAVEASRMWLTPSAEFESKTIEMFATPTKAKDGSERGLGWDVPGGHSTAGYLGPEEAFGHLGYTGTSLWIHRKKQTAVVLLTNRTYCQTNKEDMNAFRRDVHETIWKAL